MGVMAQVSGEITTSFGLRLTNATVTLTNSESGSAVTANTGASGVYSFDKITVGRYELTAKAEGYRPTVRRFPVGSTPLRINLELDPVDSSVATAAAAVSAKPNDANAFFELGRAYFRAGDIERAGQAFEKSVELKPDAIHPRIAMIQTLLRRGDVTRALHYIDDTLRLEPRNAFVALLRGATLRALGRYDDAQVVLLEALASNPNQVETLLELGVLFVVQKKFAEAEEYFTKAYTVDPTNLRGLLGVAEIHFQQKEPEKAIQVIAGEAAKNPTRAELRKELGTAELRAGKFDAAIRDYRTALELGKDSPEQQPDTWHRLALVYAHELKLPEAIDSAQRAVQLSPNNAAYLSTLAQYYDLSGKRAESVEMYRAALRLEPANPLILNNLAYLLADSGGNLDEALGLAQQARREQPNLTEIQDTLGWIYLKKDLVESALRVYQDLLTKNATNPTYLYHYGVALAKKGDREGAVRQFKMALENSPPKAMEALIKEAVVTVGSPAPK